MTIVEKQKSHKGVHLALLEAQKGLEFLNILTTDYFPLPKMLNAPQRPRTRSTHHTIRRLWTENL